MVGVIEFPTAVAAVAGIDHSPAALAQRRVDGSRLAGIVRVAVKLVAAGLRIVGESAGIVVRLGVRADDIVVSALGQAPFVTRSDKRNPLQPRLLPASAA